MNPEELIGAQVALRTPDGATLMFRIASLVPYEDETYAVLEEDRENGMLLVTHVEEENGEPAFVVVGDEEIISAVLEKQVARAIARAMESDRGDECDCGHDHHHGCSCGHEHH